MSAEADALLKGIKRQANLLAMSLNEIQRDPEGNIALTCQAPIESCRLMEQQLRELARVLGVDLQEANHAQ